MSSNESTISAPAIVGLFFLLFFMFSAYASMTKRPIRPTDAAIQAWLSDYRRDYTKSLWILRRTHYRGVKYRMDRGDAIWNTFILIDRGMQLAIALAAFDVDAKILAAHIAHRSYRLAEQILSLPSWCIHASEFDTLSLDGYFEARALNALWTLRKLGLVTTDGFCCSARGNLHMAHDSLMTPADIVAFYAPTSNHVPGQPLPMGDHCFSHTMMQNEESITKNEKPGAEDDIWSPFFYLTLKATGMVDSASEALKLSADFSTLDDKWNARQARLCATRAYTLADNVYELRRWDNAIGIRQWGTPELLARAEAVKKVALSLGVFDPTEVVRGSTRSTSNRSRASSTASSADFELTTPTETRFPDVDVKTFGDSSPISIAGMADMVRTEKIFTLQI